MRCVPRSIRSDNGPESIAHAIRRWLAQVDVQTLCVEPGSPWENGYAESFHSRVRDEFLSLEIFDSLQAARKLTAAWKEDYNHHRPHGSLGYQSHALCRLTHQRSDHRQFHPCQLVVECGKRHGQLVLMRLISGMQ
jgi:putative transposase